jgi:hypothetical protein
MKLRFKSKKPIWISDGGYYHFPVCYIGWGDNAVMICVFGQELTFYWKEGNVNE